MRDFIVVTCFHFYTVYLFFLFAIRDIIYQLFDYIAFCIHNVSRQYQMSPHCNPRRLATK